MPATPPSNTAVLRTGVSAVWWFG